MTAKEDVWAIIDKVIGYLLLIGVSALVIGAIVIAFIIGMITQ